MNLKIKEPIEISSVTNLFDKGVDLKLYKKEEFEGVLNKCAPKEYVDVIIEEMKK